MIRMAMSRVRPRAAFTFIEMMMVMAIIAILAGLALPAWMIARRSSERRAAQGLLDAVTLAAAVYQQRWWTYTDPVLGRRTVRMWDWNGDGILDGRPVVETPGPTATALQSSGYTGFYTVANPVISKARIDAAERILDPWRQPLRIAFAVEAYGVRGFTIWSTGADAQTGSVDTRKDDLVLSAP